MRILITGDVHWSETSSIVRTIGKKYSTRLENLINSVNWVEDLSIDKKCDRVIYLGDFFDRDNINCTEITALKAEVNWNDYIPHDFVVGNHESNVKTLDFSTTMLLKDDNNHFNVINKPTISHIADFSLCYIPYLTEDIRKDLINYVDGQRRIVISHNDIKGIQYGGFLSKDGFDLKEIEDNCDLFINGHLHNGNFLNEKETILNLGNLTGQNFTEDASNYSHLVVILDTATLQMEFYENPYAFNFYKFEINDEKDLAQLKTIKNNSVVTVKCSESLKATVEEMLKDTVASRVILIKDTVVSTSEDGLISINNINHHEEFMKCARSTLGNSEVLEFELTKILGA